MTRHLGPALRAWTGTVQRHAWKVLIAFALLGAALASYTAQHLGVNTDTTDMISADLQWRQDFIEFREAFPLLWRSLIVVLDADSADLADDAQARLTQALAEQPQFAAILAPETDPFFTRHGLLYQSPAELQRLGDQLARVQPFIGHLARDPSLHGIANLLALAASQNALDKTGTPRELGLDPLYAGLAMSFEAARDGRFYRLPWMELMGGDGAGAPDQRRRIIALQPLLDYGSLAPAAQVIDTVRHTAQSLQIDAAHGVRLRLTGAIALEHEELRSVASGAKIAGLVSLGLVGLVMFAGLRAWQLVLATLLSLIVGLIVTAAFAAVAVGALNLISIAFAVLYIGLGVDFAVHLCLRYRELVREGVDHTGAMAQAGQDTGASLVLCAITTSIGFLAFFPTAFAGVAELGLISGVGMYISLFMTLTFLPALIHVLPPINAATSRSPGVQATPTASHASRQLDNNSAPAPRRNPTFTYATTLLALAAAVLVLLRPPGVQFDPNPLSLRDSQSESVRAYNELLADPQHSPLRLNVLVSPQLAAETAQALSEQPNVHSARWLGDLVPAQQDEKLRMVEELAFLMGPDLAQTPRPAPAPSVRTLASMQQSLRTLGADQPSAAGSAARRCLDAIHEFAQHIMGRPADMQHSRLHAAQTAATATLPAQLQRLNQLLQAGPITMQTLPKSLRSVWLTGDGRMRVEASSAAALVDSPTMAQFVEQVHTRAPGATGMAVVQLRAGDAVLGAFRQALISAVIVVGLLLIVLLRSVTDSLLALVPVLLAGVFTSAVFTLMGLQFNFANIIALPLLLGMGVDNGIHLLHRHRHTPPPDGRLLRTSTSRAIVLSALTTMVSFGTLATSSHPGTASMGLLLAIGLGMILVTTLLILPTLLRATR